MLVPKSTLEQIEFYSVTEERIGGTYTDVDDVITLHFKQWWKRDKTIRIIRIVDAIDADSETFHHMHSESAIELITQLDDYIVSTFSDSPEKRKRSDVIKLVVDNER
ncbi:hypothetical protein MNBD_GAMMA08-7 [hydrothermal vent metagenome]|uniref:Uncharacterized protein n=1 Tax=hydrothermal vent metagenome TaxID=652676 RepID=A0A3B0WU15_9ZZZZ